MPRVSVIIESYNHEYYIAETIQSVLDQEYQDFEIIITDDGSCDQTVDVIKSFKDPRIKLYSLLENQGACVAAKYGIEKAQGEFIARLSSDDICHPARLKKQVDFLDINSSISAIFSYAEIIDESSHELIGDHPYKKVFIQENRTRFEWLRHFFFKGNCLCHPSLLIRRKCYQEIGVYDPRFRQLPDFDFWIRLCMSHEIHIIKENLIKFRIHSNDSNASSSTIDNTTRLYMENVQILKKNYLNSEIFKNFYEIFSPNNEYLFGEIHEDLLPFYMAMVSLDVSDIFHRSFAIDMLYEILAQEEKASKLEKLYNFKYKDLFDIVAKCDVFQTSKIANLYNEIHQQHSYIETLEKRIDQIQYKSEDNLKAFASGVESFSYKPVFSIVFPVYNTPENYLRDAIESVIHQIYPYWELCIADDASTKTYIKAILEEYSRKDSRIKVVYRNENGHISRTSNSAIEIATGEYIALFDHDDLLTSDALYEMALLINQHPEADMIYSDEDKVDDNNQFIFPTYKPDWCPDSFLSRMYTCHFGVYRRSLINEIGGFRVGYEGSQDYDLVLRLTEKTNKIFHIPKILYHWRLHAGSTSASTTAKTYAYEAGFKALTDALNRRGENGNITSDEKIPGHYHAHYEVTDHKLVSIIICFSDASLTLNQCLESIFARTLYSNYEVILIDNGCSSIESKEIIEEWQRQEPDRLKHYSLDTRFNFSKSNNYAATKAKGDYLLFLNSDIIITQDDWLDLMVEQVQRKSIGAVSAFILDTYNAIQHVGLVLGLGQVANHIYKGISRIEDYENLAYISLIKNVAAVTGDCLLCRRDTFKSINGFDETLPVFYNDVDLCLRMLEGGYHNVVIPHVKFVHQELTTWKFAISQKERSKLENLAAEIMQNKWGYLLTKDPCISPHIIRDINSKMQVNIAQSSNTEFSTVEKTTDDISFKPLVSVCIPTYNGAQFIEEAINCVLSQTYPNLEIIISDDSSTDKTVEIAKSFQEKTSHKLFVLEHSQYGLAQNWNFCISQAKGKYIKFLFQDDLIAPNAIEEMVNLAEQDNEIGLVFSPRKIFTRTDNAYYDSNFLAQHEAKDVHTAWPNLQQIQSGQELLQCWNLLENPINKIGEPSTVLLKKEIFEEVGLFKPEFCQLVDLEMWLRIMTRYKIAYIDQVLSYFRIHSQQQTRRNSTIKDAILSDYQKLFRTICSDKYYPQSTRESALYKLVSLSDGAEDLGELRRELAKLLLIIPDNLFENAYQGILGKTYQILFQSQVNSAIWTKDDEEIVSNSLMTISQDINECSGWLQSLLVATLYHKANKLLLPLDLCKIPDWFLSDYLRCLFSAPVTFTSIGESDNYNIYIHDWVNYLHASIREKTDTPFWQNIANKFAQIANFIPAYFNDENLKDVYVKRSEIIDLSLKNSGQVLDYEFGERPISRRKIRLGILASHYTPAAETFAALPVYEYLSREFEVILYSFQQTNHPLEQYCRSSANLFVTLPDTLAEQVRIIRDEDLDILFFATNVTAITNQMCLLASHRLARIQITSGGSVVTTGMKNMDYFISGTLTDPSPIAQEQYREKLIQLPGAAHCFSYGDFQEKSSITIERQNLGIAEDRVVFTSGANFYKIIPELIHTWAKIISAVPNSIIILFPFGPNWSTSYPKQVFEQHLHKIFAEYGVSPDRVMALDPQPVPNREDLKEYFKLADIYLDSFPFAGTTSLIEPLQVDLPVITRQGNCFRSAMGAAIIQSLGIPDLVAHNEESYIQLAVNLGNNPGLCHQKSNEIRGRMQNNPSFLDSRSYSAKIGALFIDLFDRYSKNAQNEKLQLRDINLMVFPDWNQSEESVGYELQQVIQTLATQPNAQNTTLLIDTTNIANEDAQMFLSSIAMNIMMEEDLDITEGIEISLIEDLNNIQWENLLPRINSRIVMECDDQKTIKKLLPEQLAQRQIESFVLN